MEERVPANTTKQTKVGNRSTKPQRRRPSPPPMQRIAKKRVAARTHLESHKQRGRKSSESRSHDSEERLEAILHKTGDRSDPVKDRTRTELLNRII